MEEEMGKEKGGDAESSNNQKSQETPKKRKSCKGCLYYSSTIKSNSSNPRCVGITRSLPGVPSYVVGKSKMEAKGDFKYGCVGYSVFSDEKDTSASMQGTRTELPICVGFEVLLDRKVHNPDTVPAWVHNRDTRGTPQPQAHKPPHSIGDEFLSRFSRNATVVATGVAKNLRKVGNHIKDRVDDILYPYRRRPK